MNIVQALNNVKNDILIFITNGLKNKADKATTLEGYGITDAASLTHTHDVSEVISGGTLPVANGGTDASTPLDARKNLGFAHGSDEPSGTPDAGEGSIYFRTGGDAVVEVGINGIWTYRKWASGIAECWGNYICFGATCISVSGSMYESGNFALSDYPFEFASIPTQTINIASTTMPYSLRTGLGTTTTNPGQVSFVGATSVSDADDIMVSIYAIGRVKKEG